ncbi:hypothetical protein ACX1N5_10515 [Acinetobacter sp. ANC 4636]
MLKYVVVLSGLALLTGCQTTSVIEKNSYSTAKDSRIRLYGQNQQPTILKYKYNGKSEKINVGGEAGDAFSSLIGTVKNQSIGIAQTTMSENLKAHNGILSKAFFKEFVIPAGTPISIHNSFIGLSNVLPTTNMTLVQYEGSCTSSGLTFIAKAGKDYEAIPSQKSSACGLVLLEIDSHGNTKQVSF